MSRWLSLLLLLPAAGWAAAPSSPEEALYREECGSCHLPFPPGFLSAGAWQQVMGQLDRHYGANALLEEGKQRTILAYLQRTAPGTAKGERAVPPQEGLPRFTQSGWFVHEHRKVAALAAHEEVRTMVNCSACHQRAAEGSYREREIVLPGGRRWED